MNKMKITIFLPYHSDAMYIVVKDYILKILNNNKRLTILKWHEGKNKGLRDQDANRSPLHFHSLLIF